MAIVWSDRGQGVRALVVFYNRSNEAAQRLALRSFDWDAIFKKGVRWFHSGGIFSALSSTTPELDVYDRVGGGDGFAAGLFYGLLSGKSPEESLCLGWAHGALVTTTPGDTSMFSLDQVEAFAKGGSARIQR